MCGSGLVMACELVESWMFVNFVCIAHCYSTSSTSGDQQIPTTAKTTIITTAYCEWHYFAISHTFPSINLTMLYFRLYKSPRRIRNLNSTQLTTQCVSYHHSLSHSLHLSSTLLQRIPARQRNHSRRRAKIFIFMSRCFEWNCNDCPSLVRLFVCACICVFIWSVSQSETC